MTGAARRVAKELDEIKKSSIRSFRNIQADAKNILLWKGLLAPADPPYNQGAFTVKIIFPREYPFKPPKVTFKTKIYHPNVDEMGNVCLPIISVTNWKPQTKIDQVIQALILLVNNPEPEHPLRPDVAKEFTEDHKTFLAKAEEHTHMFSEQRPSE